MTLSHTTPHDSALAAQTHARLEGFAITAALLQAAVAAGTPLVEAVRAQLANQPIHIAPWHTAPLAIAPAARVCVAPLLNSFLPRPTSSDSAAIQKRTDSTLISLPRPGRQGRSQRCPSPQNQRGQRT